MSPSRPQDIPTVDEPRPSEPPESANPGGPPPTVRESAGSPAPLSGPHASPRPSFDYELIEELAAGGMGVVYRARQVSLNRLVAVKMIRSGHLASVRDRRRFFAEAETAALLDHPNIVPIYEVGEIAGQPFLSMKLVEGGSLSHELPRLAKDLRHTAAILAQVARAVHHAHQHGILHRDLKPANILIDQDGRPHVTDFGLAKRIEGDSGLTQSGVMVGTPSYMAPEQTIGGQLTVAADVYGLGAILYECLTDRPPFVGTTVYDTVVMVRNSEPMAPSRARADVPRDLETICLKALAKEPARRYASAAEFADDLERFLAGEPVRARPVGLTERVVKWARRRPAAAGLVAVSLAAATALVGLGAWSYVRIAAERDSAVQAWREAGDAASDMYVDVAAEWLADQAHKDELHHKFLDNALRVYRKIAAEGGEDAGVRQKTAVARFHMGSILRMLGRSAESEEAYRQAIDAQRALLDEQPDSDERTRDLAESYNWLGELYREGGRRLADAEEAYRQAHALQSALVARSPRPEYRRDLARTLYNLGIVLMDTGLKDEGRPEAARRDFREAVELLKRLDDEGHRGEEYRHNRAQSLNNLGVLEKSRGNRDEARACYEQARQLLEDLRLEAGWRPRYRLDLAVTLKNLGNLRVAEGRPREALAILEEALNLARDVVRDFPGRPKYRRELAGIHTSLGVGYASLGDAREARDHWEEALRLLDRLVADAPEHPDYLGQRGAVRGNLGWLRTVDRRWAEAVPEMEAALRDLDAAQTGNPFHPDAAANERSHRQTLGEAQLQRGDHAAAARTADALGEKATDARSLFIAACFRARCAALAEADVRLSPEERRAQGEAHASAAEAWLTQAVARGFHEDDGLFAQRKTIFGRLLDRPAFARLFTDLDARRRPGPR